MTCHPDPITSYWVSNVDTLEIFKVQGYRKCNNTHPLVDQNLVLVGSYPEIPSTPMHEDWEWSLCRWHVSFEAAESYLTRLRERQIQHAEERLAQVKNRFPRLVKP